MHESQSEAATRQWRERRVALGIQSLGKMKDDPERLRNAALYLEGKRA